MKTFRELVPNDFIYSVKYMNDRIELKKYKIVRVSDSGNIYIDFFEVYPTDNSNKKSKVKSAVCPATRIECEYKGEYLHTSAEKLKDNVLFVQNEKIKMAQKEVIHQTNILNNFNSTFVNI